MQATVGLRPTRTGRQTYVAKKIGFKWVKNAIPSPAPSYSPRPLFLRPPPGTRRSPTEVGRLMPTRPASRPARSGGPGSGRR